MTSSDMLKALLLGGLEGLTEFVPVSSTGHLLLAGHLMGDLPNSKTFTILIQFGAILAILSVYANKLWLIAKSLPKEPEARRFTWGVLIAFLPAMIVGGIFGPWIKEYLFDPKLVCYTLIAGGLVLIAVEAMPLKLTYKNPYIFPLPMYLKIGILQCMAMVPGVSRSGATIVGAMLLGASKRAAAEFSFFLAIPTMAGAFAYDLFKNRNVLTLDDFGLIAIGFAAAFVVGFFVVRVLLDFVSKRGYAIFGWWRIVIGTAGLIALYTVG